MSESNPEVQALVAALAAPFDPREIKWKPSVVTGNRALALAYVDARVIQDRLDTVLGVTGWQDEYEVLPSGEVICKLRLRLGGEWVMKMDVGGQSEQKDEGDRLKAAFSDALKRAAVKFGVGRFLYRLPAQWCPYDPHKKCFAETPRLPAGLAPAKAPAPPADGAALEAAALRLDEKWSGAGACPPGHVVNSLRAWAVKEMGCEMPMPRWPADVVEAGDRQLRQILRELKEAGAPIGEEYRQKLQEMLDQKGARFSQVVAKNRWPGAKTMAALTLAEWRLAMNQLAEMPDVEPART